MVCLAKLSREVTLPPDSPFVSPSRKILCEILGRSRRSRLTRPLTTEMLTLTALLLTVLVLAPSPPLINPPRNNSCLALPHITPCVTAYRHVGKSPLALRPSCPLYTATKSSRATLPVNDPLHMRRMTAPHSSVSHPLHNVLKVNPPFLSNPVINKALPLPRTPTYSIPMYLERQRSRTAKHHLIQISKERIIKAAPPPPTQKPPVENTSRATTT